MPWLKNYSSNSVQTNINTTSIKKAPEKPDPRYDSDYTPLGGGIYEGPDGKRYHENGDEVTE